MKKILLALSFCAASFAGMSQLKTPSPSSTQIIKQDFGLGFVELSYSRPNIKERKIMGDLVPYDKVWRTGANQATTLSFSDEVTIGGKKIPAGKYGLLTIPGKDNWTIIISKQVDVTSPASYKQDQDVVRVSAKPITVPSKVESFTMQFGDVKATSCALYMMWENTLVSLPILTEVDSKVMAQIDELMKTDKPPYFNAAMYYMDNGKDLNKALDWFNKAAAEQPDAFWVYHNKAKCLAKLGKKQDAITAANKSIELAKVAKNDDYVALNEKLLATLK